MDLTFQVYGKIAKPVDEVFDAVHDPAKISRYFTTGGASAPLDEGATVMWDFADFPGAFPVHVRKVEKNRTIEIDWQAAGGPGANNGYLKFWIEEDQRGPVTGVDNDTRRIDRVRNHGGDSPR